MGWFGKSSEQTIRLPFPAERIIALSSLLPVAVLDALKLRREVSPDVVFASSFFNSYLCAYPRYLEEHIDERMGAPVRLGLLRSVLGASEAEAQFRFNSFRLELDQDHRPTWEAFRLAEDDGTTYFRAVIAGSEVDHTATKNLRLAVRGMTDFPKLSLPW